MPAVPRYAELQVVLEQLHVVLGIVDVGQQQLEQLPEAEDELECDLRCLQEAMACVDRASASGQ